MVKKKVKVVYSVKQVMSKPLITIDIEASVKDAVDLMVSKNIGAVVINQEKKPVGIVTESDILNLCSRGLLCEEVKIIEVMSEPLITIDHESPIGIAVKKMADSKIRRLLVTENRKITGIVTERDLLKGTLEAFRILELALNTL
jgi:CBS domain-containing protein